MYVLLSNINGFPFNRCNTWLLTETAIVTTTDEKNKKQKNTTKKPTKKQIMWSNTKTAKSLKKWIGENQQNGNSKNKSEIISRNQGNKRNQHNNGIWN